MTETPSGATIASADRDSAAVEGGEAISPSTSRIESLIDEVSVQIMAAGLDDLHPLGAVDAGLEALSAEWAPGQESARRLTGSLSAVIVKLMLEEVENGEAVVDLLARGIALLQGLHLSFVRTGMEVIPDQDAWRDILALAGDEPAVAAIAAEPASNASDAEPALPATAAPPLPAPIPPEAIQGLDPSLFADFHAEATEHFSSAESAFLALESDPTNLELLNAVFRAFHTVKGAAGFLNLQNVTRVAHAVEDVLDSARKGKLQLTAPVLDVALEGIDLLKALLDGVQARMDGGTAPLQDLAGFIARVEQAAAQSGEPATPAVESPAPEAPAAAPPPPARGGGADPRHQDQNFLRVGTAKLDHLINMVGELVIAQTQVSQNPEVLRLNGEKITRDMAQLNRVTRDIQEVAMSMRMVPIRPTFERMARLIRDLARKLDKQVEFRMTGEDTELDKNMVEEIADPLIHMIRNAVDHGLEDAAGRRAAGKSERGVVLLEAYHKAGSIVIELSDDGRGLDRDRILSKAIERGLAAVDEEYTDEQIYEFLFRPGFSLAKQVSDISGRGVGMDVVRRSIEKLHGKIEVRSQLGNGSTFSMRLPLTLAIIDGMVVGVGEERYILPLTSIVRSLRPAPEQIITVMGERELIKVQDGLFPLLRLHQRFGIEPTHPEPCEGLVVLVEAEGGRCCVLVDQLLGMQQVVIKGLDSELRRERSLAGCTILGDGRVGLILDTNGLVEQSSDQEPGLKRLEEELDGGRSEAIAAG